MNAFSLAMEAASAAVLVVLLIISRGAAHNFKKSRQALVESASFVNVIVDALTARMNESESAVDFVKTELEGLTARSSTLEWEQASLQTTQTQLVAKMQEALNNNKSVVAELELLKAKIMSPPTAKMPVAQSRPVHLGGFVGQADVLTALTPTERQTLDILLQEGSKGAPDLGKQLNKSREHTARLMKKLYLEGYVDRESNRAPFRYKLTDPIRSALEAAPLAVTGTEREPV